MLDVGKGTPGSRLKAAYRGSARGQSFREFARTLAKQEVSPKAATDAQAWMKSKGMRP